MSSIPGSIKALARKLSRNPEQENNTMAALRTHFDQQKSQAGKSCAGYVEEEGGPGPPAFPNDAEFQKLREEAISAFERAKKAEEELKDLETSHNVGTAPIV
jgi:hypothetical protein